MRYLFAFLIMFFVSVACSQNDKSYAAENHTGDERRGSEKSPLVVKIFPSLDAEKEAEAQKYDREQKAQLDGKLVTLTDDLARYTGDLAFLTGCLFAIGIIQLFVFGYQSVILNRTVNASVTDSQPVLSPKIINMDGLHLIIRNGTHIWFKEPETHKSIIYFIFENFGKTPGMIRQVKADLFLTERDKLPNVDWDNLPIHHHQETMPGETRAKDWEGPAVDFRKDIIFSSQQFNELIAESSITEQFRRFFLAGVVIYDDFFGMRHTRRFCLKLRVAENVRFQAQHGGAAYNNFERKKIPKNDPLYKSNA